MQEPRQAAVGAPGGVDQLALQLALEPRQSSALCAEEPEAPALRGAAGQSAAALARGRGPGIDLATAEEPASALHMMGPMGYAPATGEGPPTMTAAALKQVPELVRQAARSPQVPGWEKLQVARHP